MCETPPVSSLLVGGWAGAEGLGLHTYMLWCRHVLCLQTHTCTYAQVWGRHACINPRFLGHLPRKRTASLPKCS